MVKLHSIVDTVCVYADPEKTSVVALIVPMDTKLQDTRNQLGLSSSTSKEELCANETLIDVVLKEIIEMAKPHLERFETPRKIAVLSCYTVINHIKICLIKHFGVLYLSYFVLI